MSPLKPNNSPFFSFFFMKKLLFLALLALGLATTGCNDALDRISDMPDLIGGPGGHNEPRQPGGGSIEP
jgi:hypothetical protein